MTTDEPDRRAPADLLAPPAPTFTRDEIVELLPLVRRVAGLDPDVLVRLRGEPATIQLLARLPFDVLVARTVPRAPALASLNPSFDHVLRAAELVEWSDAHRGDPPPRYDLQWRGSPPPAQGWRRVDTVPSAVVRHLVQAGAQTFRDAAQREGVPGAAPRAAVSDALLDSVVLTVSADASPDRAEVTLRMISALARMGFLAEQSAVTVDVSGRWTRVAAAYGSVYAERPGATLGVIRS
jgi:hypothetical protein